MRCVSPFVKGGQAFGCGQCLPCRETRRRTWTHRIILEAMCHDVSSFITLTYEDSKVPAGGTLRPKDLQDWLKRIRRFASPTRLRFYAVGEYGDRSGRPHYHCALFGFSHCTGYAPFGGSYAGACQCVSCCAVRKTWGFGHVLVGTLDIRSARYLSGYVTKKMTSKVDPRLLGRSPEFARMSRHPGIGADALWDCASEMLRYDLARTRGIPYLLRHGSRMLPLGRYLRKKLGEYCGVEVQPLDFEGSPMSMVQKFAFNNSRSISSVYEELNEGYAATLAAQKERRTL